jgi:hypothetical protein
MSVTMEARLRPRARCMPIVGHTHNSRIFGYHAQEKMVLPRWTAPKDRKHLVMRVQIESNELKNELTICTLVTLGDESADSEFVF